MKRLFCGLLCLLLLIGLAGCGSLLPAAQQGEHNETMEVQTMKPTETSGLSALLDRLGYDYTILDERTLRGDLLAFYDAEAEQGKREGYTPVLVAGEMDGILFQLNEGYDIQAELKKELPSGRDVLDSYRGYVEEILDEVNDMSFDPEMLQANVDCFEPIENALTFGGEVALVKLPTTNPWEAAILLPFGGFNECPSPEEMAAVLKLWYEQYGAVPAAISYDSLSLRLPEPIPADEAESLAIDQFGFDFDLTQSDVSPLAYASILTQTTVWNFWWD